MKKLFNTSKLPFYILLFSFISIALINSFICDKHFSADGVHYFYQILEKKDFVHHDWARQFSLYITQWPVVLAVNLGIRNIPLLSFIFAFGIYSIYILTFLACIHALRSKDMVMLIWPIASMVGLNLSTDYHLSGEYPVVMLMAWPILFYLIRQNRNRSDELILWILMIIYSRIYQSAAVISLIFVAVLLYQYFILKEKRVLSKIMIPGLICVLIFSISLITILHPHSQRNEINFLEGIIRTLNNTEAMVSISFLILFFSGTFFKKNWVLIVSTVPLIVYMIIMISTSQGISAYTSFSSRSLSVTFLPVLMIFSLIAFYYKLRVSRTGIVIFFFYIVLLTTGNLKYSTNWNEYRLDFIATIEKESGFVAIEETSLYKDKCFWRFPIPLLSLVWSDGCVKSILINKYGTRQIPYDPYKSLLLKDYIKYDEFFLQIDNSARICH